MSTPRTAYPPREQYFAQKFIRRLVKSAAAQEIGVDAFALLVVVATTEDAKRYSGPVTFYNGQLLPLLGFGKWERLDRARDAAVKAGWLHYAPPQSGHRQPGAYWVLTPGYAAELSDSPVDESPQEHYPDSGEGKGNPPPDHIPNRDTLRDTLRGNHLSYALEEEIGEAKPSPEQGEGGGVIFLVKGGYWLLPPGKTTEWQETYPHLDVAALILKARQWCRDNPTKRKTAGGMLRFLNGWLSGEKPKTVSTAPSAQALYPAAKPPRVGVRTRG